MKNDYCLFVGPCEQKNSATYILFGHIKDTNAGFKLFFAALFVNNSKLFKTTL